MCVVPASRRTHLLVGAAATVAVGVVAVLIVTGAVGASGPRPCSTYPTPGTAAPSGTQVPASLVDRYAVLRTPQRGIDRLPVAAGSPR